MVLGVYRPSGHDERAGSDLFVELDDSADGLRHRVLFGGICVVLPQIRLEVHS